MKTHTIITKLMLALVTAVAALHQPDAAASHFRYANLSWVPTTNPGEVEFQLIASFRRSRFPGQGTAGDLLPQLGDVFNDGHTLFAFGDATSTPVLRFRCTAFSVTEDWIVGEVLQPATDTANLRHTYAGAGPFEAGINDCCRVEATALNNRANGSYRSLTSVTPLSGNRSPVSTLVPIINVPVGPAVTFTIPASDPDGDRIRFRLATDAEAGGCCAPPNLAIDPNTGIMTWNDVGLDTTRFWTVQVIVEDLDGAGAVKSRIPVDFLLKITPVTIIQVAPVCAITPPGPFTVTAGTPITFTVCGTDSNATDQITINSGGLPGGATMTPSLPVSGPASGVCSTFNWTPGGNQGGNFPMLFSVTDQAGNQTRCEVSITVQPISDVAISKTASPAALSVGGAITYTMVANNSGPSQASGVVITDTLPAGVNFVSVTTTLGSCSVAGSVVTCTLGAMASGGNATVIVTGMAATQGAKVNTASVSSGSLDPVAANNSATASVTVTNRTPVANDDSFATDEGVPIAISAPGILINDTDDDGDALVAILVSGPAHGTLLLNPDGSFNYIPFPNYSGPDSFSYSASDGAASSLPVIVSIIVREVNSPPVITCPRDLTLSNEPGQCYATAAFTVTATGTPLPTIVCTLGGTIITSPWQFPVGNNSVNCTAVNVAGASSCSFTVTVADREAPRVVCPVELLPYRSADYHYTIIGLGDLPPAGFEQGSFDGSAWAPGFAAFGTVGGCPLDATVQTYWPVDSQLLVRRTVQVPAGATALQVGIAIDNDVAAVYFNGTLISGYFTHEFCATYDSLVIPVPQSLVQAGPNLLALQLVDRGGVSFFDARVWGVVPCGIADITVGNDAGQCAAVVSYPPVQLSDNCSVATVDCVPSSGSTFPVGTSAVTCIARDAAGNSATYQFNVTVRDTERPTLSCGDLVAGNNPGQCAAVVATYDVRASDNCGAVAVACLPPAGSTFPNGVSTVNCTAIDTAGNTSPCNFTVTVEDRESPRITCPADITAVDAACDGEVVTWALQATDNCGVTARGCNPMRGSIFPPGTTTVLCTATDAAGHSVQCSFTVKVLCVPTAKIIATPLFFCPPIMTRPAMISCNGSNSALTLDGSMSSDPETPNSGLTFQWFDEPALLPFATGEIVSNAVFALGPHTIKLVVTDPDGLSDTDELVVDNITVCEAIDVVMDDINSSALPRKEKRPLLSALKSACNSFSRGKCNSGRKKLDAFLKKVDQHIAPRPSTGSHDQGGSNSHPGYPAEAARFKACVQGIIDAIEAADRLQMCVCHKGHQHHDKDDRPPHEHTSDTPDPTHPPKH